MAKKKKNVNRCGVCRMVKSDPVQLKEHEAKCKQKKDSAELLWKSAAARNAPAANRAAIRVNVPGNRNAALNAAFNGAGNGGRFVGHN